MNTGIEFDRSVNWLWVHLAWSAVVSAVAALIWLGPVWCMGFCVVAVVAAAGALQARWQAPGRHPAPAHAVAPLASAVTILLAALVLKSLFQSPLPDQTLKLPRFTQEYVDPDGHFRLMAPAGWTCTPKNAADHFGVSLQPESQGRYMGVSEVQILIRPLDHKPKDTGFLVNMANAVSGRADKAKKQFTLNVFTADLISGSKGAWAILDAKKLWIQIRQVTLFGIKADRYLCTVSANGLKPHSTLSQVLCLGLFEKLDMRVEKP